ncbi:MAG: hypothetical protein FWF51_08035 [Chitinivibrionia bacterium]|nr:hypothetical protein [Chitinivibrionia bacterium]
MAGNVLTVNEWIEAGKPHELYVGVDGIPTLVTVTETDKSILVEYEAIWSYIEESNVSIDDVNVEKITGSLDFSVETSTIEKLSITIIFNDEEMKVTRTHLRKFSAYIKEKYLNLDIDSFPISVNVIDTNIVVDIAKIFLRKTDYSSFRDFLEQWDYNNFEKIYDITFTASNIKVEDKSDLFHHHTEELKLDG